LNTYDFAHGKARLRSLDFDSLSYSDETLVDLCAEIFFQVSLRLEREMIHFSFAMVLRQGRATLPRNWQLELDSRLGLSRLAIRDFIAVVSRRMPPNPYHNWAHVADVTQAVYALGALSGALGCMHDGERLALLMAALCHDLEHPVRPAPCRSPSMRRSVAQHARETSLCAGTQILNAHVNTNEKRTRARTPGAVGGVPGAERVGHRQGAPHAGHLPRAAPQALSLHAAWRLFAAQ
jgi:hypothetical protein